MNNQNARDGLDPGAGHEAPQRLRPGRLTRLAWLPVLLLAMAIIAARAAGLRESYPSETLTLVLSVIFYTLVSLGTLFLIGRSFLASGTPGLLLLECGVILWSLAGTVGDAVSHGNANVNVTIFNLGILVAGVCHLAGAILSLRPQRAFRARPEWLAAGCALILGVLWLIAQAALSNWLPVFFIPGQGGTPVRYSVLISAIAMFVLSAGLLHAGQRARSFTTWYALALLLLAVGLFGVMIQLSLGCVVNWLGRTAQWLGGVYLLLAAVAALRESDLPLFPSVSRSRQGRYRYVVAISIVFAATALRFVLSPALGTQAVFLTFYPAVILAALYGGGRAGMLAAVFSALIVDFFWLKPVGHFTPGRPTDWVNLLFFFLSCTMISFIVEAMHKVRDRLILHQDHLEELVKNRTAELEQEVVERKQAETALEKAQFMLSEGQRIAHVGSFEYADETRTTVWSDEECRIYGLAPGTPSPPYEVMLAKFIHPDDAALLNEAFGAAMQSGSIYELEHRIVRPDGSVRVVYDRAHPHFDEKGRLVRYVGATLDITEHKQAEEALRKALAELQDHSRMLEETNRELEGFSYTISHDLRAPLRAINGFARMLADDYGHSLEEEARRRLGVIESNAVKMGLLIDDLLAFSRAGRNAMNVTRIDMDKLVADVVAALKTSVEGVEGDIQVSPLPPAQGDPAIIRQVVTNLLENAVKFSGKRSDPRIEVGCFEQEGEQVYFVKDNGVGFDMKYYDKLFGVFQRLVTEKEFNGTGVGLAIVRRLVNRHGGRVWAEGKVDEGATFYFTLPGRDGQS